MSDIERAITIALHAHAGQRDRAGEAYILHPLRMMMAAEDEPTQIVAVLHDVVEDSAVTLDDLREAGFGAEIVAAVDSLTRRAEEDYAAFTRRVAQNLLAVRVKRLDLRDNMNVLRLRPPLSADDFDRLNQYRQAWEVLAGK